MSAQKKKQQRITYMVICGVLLASSFFLFVLWKDGEVAKAGSIAYRTSSDKQQITAIVQREKKPTQDEEPAVTENGEKETNTESSTSSSTTENPSNAKTDTSTSSDSPTTPVEELEQKQYVTISIDMKNILNHMDLVNDSAKRFVVSSGTVLSSTQISFTKGETVYSILQRICQEKGIPIVANQGYINSIHNIGEFDAGKTSGWLYTVNGEIPSVGSSGYRVKENDVIAWRYTVIQGDV